MLVLIQYKSISSHFIFNEIGVLCSKVWNLMCHFCRIRVVSANGDIMSNIQYAFIKKANIPSAEALQTSINSLGFDLKIDPDLNFLESAGFSPCVLAGIPDVGPEIFTESASESLDGNEELRGVVGERDFCIGMVWRGSMKDCASVMIISCALAKEFGAVISFEGEPPEPLEGLIEAAKEIVEDAKSER